MSIITLKNTGIETSSLGFGCGGLMRIPGARQRQKILAEAFDAGIRHFDVAPSYGLGKAETDVGLFARGRRDRVVLATKFGLEVTRASGIASAVQGVGRRVLQMFPALRAAVRKRASMFYAPKNFTVAAARQSLQESLRALRTDYLDIFLLHEPEWADVKDTGILEFLQEAKRQGMIRAWGIAGYPGQTIPVCEEMPGLAQIIQIPNDAISRQLEQFRSYSDAAFITFSPYSEAFGKIQAVIAGNPRLADDFLNEYDMDLRRNDALARLMLAYCLRSNSSGVTLFFSGRAEGVRENAATWKHECPEKIVDAFSRLMRDNVAGDPAVS